MGAAKKLGRNVWVGDRLFMAGDAPDKEFADQITNPKAWEEPEAPAPGPDAEVEGAKPAAAKK